MELLWSLDRRARAFTTYSWETKFENGSLEDEEGYRRIT
jgi:hypothetical protein